ncbi:MAG TPA: type II toxin-antitoxin system HicB family antitoxin [Candidatus Aciduliprofundum boonei]|uniref:Type II toxin-antitoxin system HicB family antitoxin n=1 Tax=Candidatus Aciduliprofundum boonei TaxID=379547 RepID=A0A7J3T9B3_9ARCH|nr:type II toxin-antitoxin system HicB family antitoxin [Candidatus Aciduliprofundum boonei]
MKMEEYTVIIERDEDGYYVGEVVELPGCFTQAKSIDELMRRIKEAIELYIEEEGEIEIKNHFVGVQRVQA